MRTFPDRASTSATLNRGFFADVGLPERAPTPPVAQSAAHDGARGGEVGARGLYLVFGWMTLALAALAADRASGPKSLAFFDSVFHVERHASWDVQLLGLSLLLGALALTLLFMSRRSSR